MYSFHSSLEEKNQLLHTLTTYGIETTVDRAKKKDRIREWIQASAIAEEYEEDESDLNEDIRILEDEDEEPSTMAGRHFPETRPVVTTENTNEHKRHRRANGSSTRRRQSTKPSGRKIPFAPQVAEERETVARLTSFPNGDPSLAFATNGTNGMPAATPQKPDASLENAKSSPSANGQLNNSNGLTGKDDRTATNSGSFKPNLAAEETSVSTELQGRGATSQPDRSLPRSPQIPARKHRSQTAPFPAAASPLLNGNRAESAKRSQSAAALPTAQADRSVSAAERSTVSASQPDGQSATSGRGERSGTRAENRSAAQSMSRVENQSVAMGAARVENQLSSALPISRNEKPGPVPLANPLTMSVASHLVMQSFNALQGMNVASEVASPGNGSVGNMHGAQKSPSATPARISSPKNSPTNTPARTSTPPRPRTNHRVEETFVYGKDPYEHYGIAQSGIARADSARRGSQESASRSVSN